MLTALSGVELGPGAPVMSVLTPRTLLYLPSPKIQIIEDVDRSLDYAHLLTTWTRGSNIPLSVHSAVGFALGVWLHTLHHWSQQPPQSEMRATIEGNEASRDLKWRTTYASIVAFASTFPTITEEDLEVLREVRAKAEREHEEATQGHVPEHTASYGIVHGDFWIGK